ncbi:unnamed protein product [Caenorhabditis brenneri]
MRNILIFICIATSTLKNVSAEFEFFNSRCEPNCIFEPYHVDSESLKVFPRNCSSVCANLLFDQNTDVTENELTKVFSNMKSLYGVLTIKKTNFTSVGFLAGLETLECEDGDLVEISSNLNMEGIGMANLTSTSCSFDINGMNEYLGLPNLKNFFIINSTLTFKVNGGLKFCVSIEEVTNVMRSDFIKDLSIYAEFCKTNATNIDGEKLCHIANFNISNFDPTCQRVVGDVIIRAGDEEFVYKLENVTWIYGVLQVYKTNLVKVDFLNSLQYVYYEFCQVNINIRYNQNLVSVVFPSLEKVLGQIYIDGSSPEFFLDLTVCLETNNSLNTTRFRNAVINDKTCTQHYTSMRSNGNLRMLTFDTFLMIILMNYFFGLCKLLPI